jgi:hypothetical protein
VAPASTKAPSLELTDLTVESIEALIVCSIFMAYNTNRGWPLVTLSPTFAKILTMVPDIGLLKIFSFFSSFLTIRSWFDSNVNSMVSPC